MVNQLMVNQSTRYACSISRLSAQDCPTMASCIRPFTYRMYYGKLLKAPQERL
jgi:hypothetical protein